MKKIFFLLFFSVIVNAGIFGQNTGLINLINGQQFAVENKVTTNSSAEMMGQTMETIMNASITYNIAITATRNELYYMNNKVAALKLNMTTMGREINFDSDKKEDLDGQIGSSVKDFINRPMKVVMDKSGNILPEENTDTTKEAASPSQSGLMMKQFGDPVKEGYGAKLIFRGLPGHVNVGTTWYDSTSADGVIKKTTFVVKEIIGENATLSFSGTEDRDIKIETQGMEVSTVTKGTFSGEELIDLKTGVVLQNNVTTDATGVVSAMGQDFPTVIKTTSLTTVKPL